MKAVSALKQIVLKLGMNSIFVLATTLLGAFAGLYGALYGDRIKVAFPFRLACCHVVPEALIFWIAFCMFGVGFAITFWAQNKSTSDALEKLNTLSNNTVASQASILGQTTKLEEIIRTLPPDGFLDCFQELYQTAQALVRETIPNSSTAKDEGKIVEAIQLILLSVARLACYFDNNPRGVRYSANVMLFKPLAGMAEADLTETKSKLKFMEQGQSLDTLEGVLQLCNNLAIDVQDGHEEASVIPTFCMPVPKLAFQKDRDRSTVIPGAPEAFLRENEYVAYADSSSIETWCSENLALRPGVAREIGEYFREGEGENVKSFASFALTERSSNPQVIGRRFGVLNIHTNQSGIFGSTERVEKLFLPATAPFRGLLCDLLHHYKI